MRCDIFRGMSTQIAVRLPDDMVAFLDKEVVEGRATSRASIVELALEREMRRQTALRDADVLRALMGVDDLAELASWGADQVELGD
jgi:Arc/MetJ-type ribon-helix-helix transcriptional regulator